MIYNLEKIPYKDLTKLLSNRKAKYLCKNDKFIFIKCPLYKVENKIFNMDFCIKF